MKIGDLVTLLYSKKNEVGIIIRMAKPVPNEAWIVWDDGTTSYTAVWALVAL